MNDDLARNTIIIMSDVITHARGHEKNNIERTIKISAKRKDRGKRKI